jgi:serine/threonine-protein kinase RsbW
VKAETLTVEARIENLPEVLEFIERSSHAVGAADADVFALKLSVEEACVNVMLHGYPSGEPGPIELSFLPEGDAVRVVVADRAAPFSPDEAPEPDLDSGWEERRPGGLGWFLIRKMMDAVEYEPRPGGGNRLTLTKRLGGAEGRSEEVGNGH